MSQVLMMTLHENPPDIDTASTMCNQYVNYGHKFRKFTRTCLMKDPAQRPSSRELLGHVYVKSKAKVSTLCVCVCVTGMGRNELSCECICNWSSQS